MNRKAFFKSKEWENKMHRMFVAMRLKKFIKQYWFEVFLCITPFLLTIAGAVKFYGEPDYNEYMPLIWLITCVTCAFVCSIVFSYIIKTKDVFLHFDNKYNNDWFYKIGKYIVKKLNIQNDISFESCCSIGRYFVKVDDYGNLQLLTNVSTSEIDNFLNNK